MKELNYNLLKNTIANLPEYSPKPALWHQIDFELTALENDVDLQISVSQLPSFTPSDNLWDQIETQLDQEQGPVSEPVSTPAKIKTAQLFSITRWAAAAGIFLTFAAGAWLINDMFSSREFVSLSYSEEQGAAQFLSVDWSEDEDAFAMVAELCQTKTVACQEPEFKVMTEELEELNDARASIKAAMEQYGNDPELIAQLTEIEHERSDLLKTIIKKI